MKRVFWSVLMERSIEEHAFLAFLGIAARCAENGCNQIVRGYQRVDVARNAIVKAFRENAKEPDDTLVMLDADHIHPADVVQRLVAHDVDVVGALAFMRGAPFTPCWFIRDELGFHPGHSWGDYRGLLSCDAVGTGAIAIKRRVFDVLDREGFGPYFFQATYLDPAPADMNSPSEDMWFATTCYQVGVKHHVDLGLCTPHLIMGAVDQQYFEMYMHEHPEIRSKEVQVEHDPDNLHDRHHA